MKTIFRNFVLKAGLLLMVFMTYYASIKAATPALVKVPSACKVVVPGAGGGLNMVGNGGIVVMPDPYSGGIFEFQPPAFSCHVLKWTLLGDIAMPPSSFSLIGNNPQVTILSYNKNQRPSEGPSYAEARGIGHVRIDYTCGGCDAAIEFEIYKTYPADVSRQYVPPIVGPDCWEIGDKVTYSVDPVASDNLLDPARADQYYWEVKTANLSIPLYYYSGDRSSITFDVPATAECDWEITCWYGRANDWDNGIDILPDLQPPHRTLVKKQGRVAPPAPNLAATLPCIPIGQTTYFISIMPPCPTIRYTWDCPYNPGVGKTPSGAQGEECTFSNLDDNPLYITVAVVDDLGACPPKTYVYRVDREFGPPMALLSTPTELCLEPGEQFTLSLPPNAMNNLTGWHVPPGWNLPTLNNSVGSSASFTVPSNILGGEYQVSASASNCPGGSPLDATICVMPTGAQISGTSCITYGSISTIPYSVTVPGPGNFDFTWLPPPGWTFASTATTNNSSSIALTPNGTTICSLRVAICCQSTGCCDTISKELFFNPVQPTIVGSVSCLQAGTTTTAEFHILNPVPGQYIWNVDPAFGTIISSQSMAGSCGIPIIDYSITVEYHLNQTVTGNVASFNTLNFPQAVTALHRTPCGDSQIDIKPVSIGSGFTLEARNYSGYSDLIFQPMPQPGVQFQWLLDCNPATPCTACGTGFVTNPMFTVGNRNIGILIVQNGCTTLLCMPAAHVYRTQGGNSGNADDAIKGESKDHIILSPNPNGGEFELQVPEVNQAADMIVFNAIGEQLFQAPLVSGSNKFSKTELTPGIYFLFLTVDGATSVKKMEVLE